MAPGSSTNGFVSGESTRTLNGGITRSYTYGGGGYWGGYGYDDDDDSGMSQSTENILAGVIAGVCGLVLIVCVAFVIYRCCNPSNATTTTTLYNTGMDSGSNAQQPSPGGHPNPMAGGSGANNTNGGYNGVGPGTGYYNYAAGTNNTYGTPPPALPGPTQPATGVPSGPQPAPQPYGQGNTNYYYPNPANTFTGITPLGGTGNTTTGGTADPNTMIQPLGTAPGLYRSRNAERGTRGLAEDEDSDAEIAVISIGSDNEKIQR